MDTTDDEEVTPEVPPFWEASSPPFVMSHGSPVEYRVMDLLRARVLRAWADDPRSASWCPDAYDVWIEPVFPPSLTERTVQVLRVRLRAKPMPSAEEIASWTADDATRRAE